MIYSRVTTYHTIKLFLDKEKKLDGNVKALHQYLNFSAESCRTIRCNICAGTRMDEVSFHRDNQES